jgi:hypothetical protein
MAQALVKLMKFEKYNGSAMNFEGFVFWQV